METRRKPRIDEEPLSEMRQDFEAWESENRGSFEKEIKKEIISDSGVPIKRVYTPLDLQERGFDYKEELGFPGQYPYTRGIDPSMYRKELPKFRQYSGFATPEESNTLFKNLICQGQTGLSLAFDLPTQLGYDSDHPMAHGEVGKTGLIVNSLKDWETTFDGIDISNTFINSVANAQSTVIFAMLLHLAEKNGIDRKQLKGSIQNDILKEYVTRGNFIFPVKTGVRLSADVMEYSAKHLPQFWPVNVCAGHYHEGGANLVHEGAFGLAAAFVYIDELLSRGVHIDDFAPNLSFNFNQDHSDFFGAISLLRAVRRLWAKTLKERYKAKDPRSMRMRMFGLTGGNSMTRQQPACNLVRNTISGMVGFLAGVQHSSLRTIDELFGIPSEEAQILSTRIQQVIIYETGITSTVDPLGGSYYVESLTSDYEEKIKQEIAHIESIGGMVEAIERGYVQKALMKDAYETQTKYEKGEIVKVGANMFVMEEKARPRKPYRENPKVEEQRITKLKELRKNRNNAAASKSLDELRKASEDIPRKNLIPYVTACIENYATMGEICSVWRDVFGTFVEPKLF